MCVYLRATVFFSDDQSGLTAKSNSRTLIPIARFEIKRPLSGNWMNSWILFSRKIHCSHSHSLTRLLKTPAKTAIRKKYLNRNLFYLFLCLTFCYCSTTEMTYDDWVFHIWKNCNCRFVFFYILSTLCLLHCINLENTYSLTRFSAFWICMLWAYQKVSSLFNTNKYTWFAKVKKCKLKIKFCKILFLIE